MIVKDEVEAETTTLSPTSTNDSSSEELPTIDWSQVPCPSQTSRRKRSSGVAESSKKKKAADSQSQELTRVGIPPESA